MSVGKICAHCGLALGNSASVSLLDGEEKFFCCSGCAFVYQLAGGGEQGDSAESIFLVLLAFGIVLSGAIMTFSWVLYLYPHLDADLRNHIQYLLLILTTPVILGLGYPYLKNALQEISHARLSMSTLIALGTVAAYVYSARVTIEHGQHVYFDTAAMVIVLVTLGKYLQARAKARMAAAMRTLAKDAPSQARRICDGQEELVPIDQVRAGDSLRALPAEKIAVDGMILEGRTTVDESILTGESLPVTRGPGDRVLQGTVNLDGAILYQAVQVGEGTLQAQIERMCAEAVGSRMPLQSLVDKVSAWFVGATILFTIGVGLYWGVVRHEPLNGFLTALAVLVVACPCALGIATPMATFVSLQRGAKEGVLIRAPEVLERMRRTDTVVFDKTGTLTEGRLRVLDVIPCPGAGMDAGKLLQIAASLEKLSEHHMGRAIVEEYKSARGDFLAVEDFVNHPGEGIEGTVARTMLPGEAMAGSAERTGIYLGTEQSLRKLGLRMPENFEAKLGEAALESRVYLGWEGSIRGVIRLQDFLRPRARNVIEQCRRQGLAVHLLSGDREASTRQVAEQLGIAHWASERLPWQKVDYVAALQQEGCCVAMVGDGVNDAPALARADVGIAHQVGTDLSKEAADIHILAGNLTLVPWVLTLAKKTFLHIQENLMWAFLYNVIAMALAAVGILRPVEAAAAMLVSSLMVVGNSLRLEKIRGVRGAPRALHGEAAGTTGEGGAAPATPAEQTEASAA
ncbi:MAG: heavy metal translocating P-type ATPase [Candidatus Acidiferrales bacterium]